MNSISLFNINISIVSFSDYIQKSIHQKNGYSCFLNSHMIYEHYKNPLFKNVFDKASFILPDGVPLLKSIRYFGKIKQERIAGNDVIFSIIEKAKEKHLSIYLVGGTDDILKIIASKLDSLGIKNSFYSPPFLPIEEFDFEYQAKIICEFKPDLILVGLGCPKQEIWMSKMKNKIQAPMYGLGGAFNLYAGVDTRAPKFMRDIGLEWIYRLALEPNRLFKRYLITNTFFIYLFVKEILKRVCMRY